MRPTRQTFALTSVVLLLTAAGCRGPSIPHPLVSQSRFTCCNLHYEKAELTDVNFQQGTLLPLGTRVEILEVGRNRVKFQPAGGTPLTLGFRYGKSTLSFDQYLERIFLTADPHARLPKSSVARQKLITQGTVEKGMTRDEVLLALGYPPAHRTPSLTGVDWHYWQNRWHQFVVFFDGDRVDRVLD